MTAKQTPAKKKAAPDKLKVLKTALKEHIKFLEQQASMEYTLRGQSESLLAQIAVLKKYLK